MLLIVDVGEPSVRICAIINCGAYIRAPDVFVFFIQFNVPLKIISLIETSQSIGGVKREYPGKPPDTPASRTCLVSHVASAGLE